MGWQPIGQPTCASCKNYLLRKKDNRFILADKVLRGKLTETHLCEKMEPKVHTPSLNREYGILQDLNPCELYELYRP